MVWVVFLLLLFAVPPAAAERGYRGRPQEPLSGLGTVAVGDEVASSAHDSAGQPPRKPHFRKRNQFRFPPKGSRRKHSILAGEDPLKPVKHAKAADLPVALFQSQNEVVASDGVGATKLENTFYAFIVVNLVFSPILGLIDADWAGNQDVGVGWWIAVAAVWLIKTLLRWMLDCCRIGLRADVPNHHLNIWHAIVNGGLFDIPLMFFMALREIFEEPNVVTWVEQNKALATYGIIWTWTGVSVLVDLGFLWKKGKLSREYLEPKWAKLRNCWTKVKACFQGSSSDPQAEEVQAVTMQSVNGPDLEAAFSVLGDVQVEDIDDDTNVITNILTHVHYLDRQLETTQRQGGSPGSLLDVHVRKGQGCANFLNSDRTLSKLPKFPADADWERVEVLKDDDIKKKRFIKFAKIWSETNAAEFTAELCEALFGNEPFDSDTSTEETVSQKKNDLQNIAETTKNRFNSFKRIVEEISKGPEDANSEAANTEFETLRALLGGGNFPWDMTQETLPDVFKQ
eukprot:CAMPEP_0172679890 /NCGR_PEP_ID=MMETSP1074-20121228/16378_1 /TAXON_ID=2916 /ORGANISM="Ceratium fusus, Strain PA161109" /LENGTH=511 /DNA_ID=CAMNT_0013498133 /DNA_START=15 /DNA_END=1547 /DNA_ORIENTATION=-